MCLKIKNKKNPQIQKTLYFESFILFYFFVPHVVFRSKYIFFKFSKRCRNAKFLIGFGWNKCFSAKYMMYFGEMKVKYMYFGKISMFLGNKKGRNIFGKDFSAFLVRISEIPTKWRGRKVKKNRSQKYKMIKNHYLRDPKNRFLIVSRAR